MAIAPNATGAVLATSATDAAFSGLKPSATSITDVIATGVPNPGQRLQQRARTRNAMDHGLDSLVVGDRGRSSAAAPRSARCPRSS